MKKLLPCLAACAAGAIAAVPIQATAYESVVGGLTWQYYVDTDEDGDATAYVEDVYQRDANGNYVSIYDTLTTLTIPDSFTAVVTNGNDYATKEEIFDAEGNFISNKWTVVESSKEVKTVTATVTSVSLWDTSFGNSLKSVTFPDSVEYIDGNFDSTNLTSVTMAEDAEFSRSTFEGSPWFDGLKDGDFVIRNGTLLAYYGDATSVTVPEGVTEIGSYAFARWYNGGSTNLTSVTLPSTLEYIGYEAFSGCEALTSIAIPEGVYSIGGSAFSSCYKLASVSLPSTLQSIDSYAFSGCGELTAITIPEGVKYIYYEAFSGCSKLASVSLPSTLKYIGYEAFYGCGALKSIVIPEGVDSIGSYAFSYCEKLASVTLPSTLESIGYRTFSECPALASIAIPEGVTYIGSYAFYGCNALKSIALPASLEDLDSYAFGYCTNLTTVTGTGANLDYVARSAFYGTPAYENQTNGIVRLGPVVFGYRGDSAATLTIPEGVTYICSYAFEDYGRKGRWEDVYDEEENYIDTVYIDESVPCALTLPASLKVIEYSAFGDSAVKTVTGGANVTEVGSYAFGGTPWMDAIYESADDPAVKFEFMRIGKVIIGFKGALPATLTLPDDVTSVKVDFGDWNSRTNVTVVNVGVGEKYIGEAFAYLPNLATVSGSAVCGLGYDAFYRCYCLTDVDLSVPSLEIDNDEMFGYCTNLVNVTFTYIDDDDDEDDGDEDGDFYVHSGAFEDCPKLATFKVLRSGYRLTGWEGLEDDAFADSLDTFRLYHIYPSSRWVDEYYDEEAGEWVNVYEPYTGYSSIGFRPVWKKVLRNAESDGAYSSGAAATYMGWIDAEDGGLAGAVTLKVMKGRNGVAKATATVTLVGERKVTIKGTIDANGLGQGDLAGLVLGANGLSGTIKVKGVSYEIDGARDVTKTRGDSEQAVLNGLKGKVWTLAFFPAGSYDELPMDARGFIGLSVTMAAKGNTKVTGTLPNGARVNAKGTAIVGGDTCCVPVVYTKGKDSFGFVLWFDRSGNALDVTEISNWKSTGAGFSVALELDAFDALSPITGTTAFHVDQDDLPEIDGVLTEFLPVDEPVTAGSRWTVNKAATIKYKKGVFDQAAYDKGVAAGKTNASALRLTYTAKTGVFKGTFKVYTLQAGKLKKLSAKVNGVVCDGIGYGYAQIRKVGSFPIFVGELDD